VGKANLTYYIFEGLLVGTVGGKGVHIFALSGGGATATKSTAIRDEQAVNSPYRTGQLTQPGKGIRGGPIPPGKYTIKKPAQWRNMRAARLEPASPLSFQAATGRDGGFLIHLRGGSGSDGCIVPVDSSQYHSLMDGLVKDDGGTLWVFESFGGSMFA
jgi:hypothetical protein